MYPLPKYVELPTSGTYKCDLIWKQSPCRGNQVKMASLGWALIQYGWCPYKCRMAYEDRHTGRTPCDDRGTTWSKATASQECQGFMATTRC